VGIPGQRRIGIDGGAMTKDRIFRIINKEIDKQMSRKSGLNEDYYNLRYEHCAKVLARMKQKIRGEWPETLERGDGLDSE